MSHELCAYTDKDANKGAFTDLGASMGNFLDQREKRNVSVFAQFIWKNQFKPD